MYFYSIGNKVYQSNNYKKMSDKQKKFVEISSNSVTRVNGILPKNEYEMLFATDRGMFQTNYRYTLHNDLSFKTENDINDYYLDILASHI